MADAAKILLIIGGIYNLGFGVFHLMFWRIFRWKRDLVKLNFVNRGIMQILNLCLTFMFFVMAYVSFFHMADMLETSLGRAMLIAISLFWFLRMIEQTIFFGIRNKQANIYTVLFSLGCLFYLVPFVIVML